jgi:hypothetical protein
MVAYLIPLRGPPSGQFIFARGISMAGSKFVRLESFRLEYEQIKIKKG